MTNQQLKLATYKISSILAIVTRLVFQMSPTITTFCYYRYSIQVDMLD